MKKKKLTVVLLFAILFGNYAFTMDFTQDVSLDSDYEVSGNIGTVPVTINMDGNGYSLNGNGFGGLQIRTGQADINIKNVGSFVLTETGGPADGTVAKMDDSGSLKYYNIAPSGSVNGFLSSSKDGGFIYNNNSSYNGKLNIENSVIENNRINSSAKNSGGAIYNKVKSGDFTVSDSYITGNGIETSVSGGTVSGGAIYNYTSRNETGTFNITDSYITNNNIMAENTINAYGGAVYSENSIVNIDGSYFGNNSVNGYNTSGGALYIEGANKSHVVNNSVFDNNRLIASNTGGGGAIYANNGNLSINNSLFSSNKIEVTKGYPNHGGAVSKLYGDNFTVINSVFENNSIDAENAGRIYGGAVYAGAKENIFENSVFKGNGAHNQTTSSGIDVTGGAVFLYGNTLKVSGSEFDSNSATSNQWSYGGAIASNAGSKNYEISGSTFNNNLAESTAQSSYGAKGGALFVYNNSVANISDSVFNGNIANSAAQNAYQKFGGGAIYVSNNSTVTVTDSSFTDNKAIGKYSAGGAILNSGANAVLNIIADKNDVVFSGNQAGTDESSMLSNAIHNDKGTINLNTGASSIIFNDSITSTDSSGVININKNDAAGAAVMAVASESSDSGAVVLNNDMIGYKGEVNLYGGALAVGADGTFFENASSFNVNGVSSLNLANGIVRNYNLGNITLNNNLNVGIDVDLATGEADGFNVDNLTINNNSKINITEVNVVADAAAESAEVVFNNAPDVQSAITVDPSLTTAMGAIYKYDVSYDEYMGTMSFLRSGSAGGGESRPSYEDVNPAVMTAPAAAQLGGYMGMIYTYNNAFTNMDRRMLNSQKGRHITDENNFGGVWIQPFGGYDKVKFKDGPEADNYLYGMFVGGDTGVRQFDNGAEGVMSAYVSYIGSHQNFDENSIYQNGGNVGLTGTLYKGNFFTGLTVSAGASIADASTREGDEDFSMLMAGAASKTGYNFEFYDGKFIIQPSLLLSYTFVNTSDYTNASGLEIEGDPLHVLQISPNIKFALNAKNNWQSYLTAAMNWDIMNDSEYTADMTLLPELSLKPYVQYGLGMQKMIGDSFMPYGEVLLQHGGRNGVSGHLGFKYIF